MRCPDCNTNFTSENQLTLVENRPGSEVPWYLPAPRNRLACPQCGAMLKHRRATLLTGAILGACFLLAMSLKILYPESRTMGILFWIAITALVCSAPFLMRSKNTFRRDEDHP